MEVAEQMQRRLVRLFQQRAKKGEGEGFLRGMEWVHKPCRSACVLELVPKLDLVLRNEAPLSIFLGSPILIAKRNARNSSTEDATRRMSQQ